MIRRLRIGTVAGVALVGVTVVALPPVVAAPGRALTEYESEARTVNRIMSENDRLAFTVVGTPAWYDRVLGAGYHVQLVDFAHALSPSDAADPSFELPIPTKRVYVLTEKKPFTTSLLADFATRRRDSGTPDEALAYHDPAQRKQLMHDVEQWMQTYDRFHHSARVVFEDNSIRVWRVEQAPNPELSKRFGIVRRIRPRESA